MLHPVQPSAHPLPVHCELLSKGPSDITHSAGILHAIPHQPQAGLIPQREECLTQQVRAWIAGDSEVVHLFRRYPRHVQTRADRLMRKPRPVLHPPKAFFLDSSDQVAVAEETPLRHPHDKH